LKSEYPVPKQGAPASSQRWWIAPGTIASAVSYLRFHVPSGMNIETYYLGNSQGFSIPSAEVFYGVGKHLGQIEYTIIRWGSHVAVREQAWRWWVPARPASEHIGTVQSVFVHLVGRSTGTSRTVIDKSYTGSVAQELADAVDDSPVADDQQRSCIQIPSHIGEMTFHTATHTITVTDYGCEMARVVTDNRAQPDLSLLVLELAVKYLGIPYR